METAEQGSGRAGGLHVVAEARLSRVATEGTQVEGADSHSVDAHERRYDDAGMATVEYALVTVAAAGFAGLLIVLLKSAEVRELLMGIIERALGS